MVTSVARLSCVTRTEYTQTVFILLLGASWGKAPVVPQADVVLTLLF